MSPLQEAGEHLAAVLEQENAALLRLDLASATALLDAKRAALARFEQVGRTACSQVEPDAAMRAVACRLRDVSTRNKCLLERAMTVQQHIMSLLADAARRAAPSTLYGRAGSYARRSGSDAFALSARA